MNKSYASIHASFEESDEDVGGQTGQRVTSATFHFFVQHTTNLVTYFKAALKTLI